MLMSTSAWMALMPSSTWLSSRSSGPRTAATMQNSDAPVDAVCFAASTSSGMFEPDRPHRRGELTGLRAEVAVLGAAAGLQRHDALDLDLGTAPPHPHVVRQRRAEPAAPRPAAAAPRTSCASSVLVRPPAPASRDSEDVLGSGRPALGPFLSGRRVHGRRGGQLFGHPGNLSARQVVCYGRLPIDPAPGRGAMTADAPSDRPRPVPARALVDTGGRFMVSPADGGRRRAVRDEERSLLLPGSGCRPSAPFLPRWRRPRWPSSRRSLI